MIQVFLSGAFFPMPSPTLVELGQVGTPGSFVIGAYDVFPATHGMRALLSAMAGEPRHAVAPLAVAAVLSAVWFIVAAVFFRRRVLG